ncbi:MAG: tetratricopeptide repeat protein [Minwuia sp.]|uniref:tetratricopeptide repeat protein n=1 Tax=Minwuia sp. TaxID=2493630 RepID=UPI003A8C3877
MLRRLLAVAAAFACLAALPALADADPRYEKLCGAAGHPDWAFGDAKTTPYEYRPLFGCDDRPGFWHKRDRTYVNRLRKLGYSDADLGTLLAEQGWVWLKKKEPALAMRRLNLAFEYAPWNGDIYHGIALAMSQGGLPHDMVGYWYAVAANQKAGRPERFADYGRFLIATGQFEKAVPVLEKSRGLLPDDTWTLMNLTQSYFATKRKPEACGAVKLLGRSEPPEGYDATRYGIVVDHWEERAEKEGC